MYWLTPNSWAMKCSDLTCRKRLSHNSLAWVTPNDWAKLHFIFYPELLFLFILSWLRKKKSTVDWVVFYFRAFCKNIDWQVDDGQVLLKYFASSYHKLTLVWPNPFFKEISYLGCKDVQILGKWIGRRNIVGWWLLHQLNNSRSIEK